MTASPCSVPDWLRFAIPLETPEQQDACREHDARYDRGGDRGDRLKVDLWFALDLLDHGMDPDSAERYFWGVRQYGASHWNGDDHAGALPLHPPATSEAP